MLGLRYNARTNTVSLLARGQHVRDEWGTTLASINGRPPGESLAAWTALMYSMGGPAVVLDVAMWVGPPTEHQWQQSINACVHRAVPEWALRTVGCHEACFHWWL